jgi:hypothetical protein
MLTLKLAGGSLVRTEDHPFWNATDHMWQEARDFDRGDLVLTAGGGYRAVAGLDWGHPHEGSPPTTSMLSKWTSTKFNPNSVATMTGTYCR